jgi:hypothetical protein
LEKISSNIIYEKDEEKNESLLEQYKELDETVRNKQ